jgi:hypothetical protein
MTSQTDSPFPRRQLARCREIKRSSDAYSPPGNKTDLEGMRVASGEKARIRHLEVSANEAVNIEQLLSVLIQ